MTYDEWREPFGYSNPPTFDDYLDFCDRAKCSPDSPSIQRWNANDFSDRFNHWSARGGCTPTIAALMLQVEWPDSGPGKSLGSFKWPT